MTQEKQFCRNCGKRDDLMRGAFWEPGLCIDCHRLPVIGMRYDVFTGKRIEPKPINCRICGQETIENVNGVCKTCRKEAGMRKDTYQFWPIRVKRNIRSFGTREGRTYWRFGRGGRWEIIGQGYLRPGRRVLGWTLFIGPCRLIFGVPNFGIELKGQAQ